MVCVSTNREGGPGAREGGGGGEGTGRAHAALSSAQAVNNHARGTSRAVNALDANGRIVKECRWMGEAHRTVRRLHIEYVVPICEGEVALLQ